MLNETELVWPGSPNVFTSKVVKTRPPCCGSTRKQMGPQTLVLLVGKMLQSFLNTAFHLQDERFQNGFRTRDLFSPSPFYGKLMWSHNMEDHRTTVTRFQITKRSVSSAIAFAALLFFSKHA